MRKPAPAAERAGLDPAELFWSLAARRGLILAVSGGPDSTALMALASRWAGRPPLLVVTVDHGLRPEAAEEARLVAANAARIGLASRIVRADEPHRAGNLQDWARRMRYRCLVAAAQASGFDTIVTAHHQDDQAETFLLRLARGSGVYGLAAMRGAEEIDGILLARPLLRIARSALAEAAAASGLATVADPSNHDPRFDRIRMRALMPALAAQGLDASRLAETAGRLGRAAGAIDHYATELLGAHFKVDPRGAARGAAAALRSVPDEVALRALARIVRAVSGAHYTPPLAATEALLAAIRQAGEGEMAKRTLSGTVVSVGGRELKAEREWGREGPADVAAPAGAPLVWDGRFKVEVPRLPGLSVAPLGRAAPLWKAAQGGRSAWRTLPGLYQDGTLLAVPPGVAAAPGAGSLDILRAECIVRQRLGLASEA